MRAETGVALASVCRILRAPRSTIYARGAGASTPGGKRGPRTALGDDQLLVLIREAIVSSPFAGEGDRKVTARLRRERGVRRAQAGAAPHAGGGSARPAAGARSPQATRARRDDHPEAPNVLWGTDATMAYTARDGWVWAFAAVDHYTAEAWASVARRGDRFAALEPIYDATRDRFAALSPDVARGISSRHDWGPQYTSSHLCGSLRWLGIEDSPSFVGEPPCNGCAERFIVIAGAVGWRAAPPLLAPRS